MTGLESAAVVRRREGRRCTCSLASVVAADCVRAAGGAGGAGAAWAPDVDEVGEGDGTSNVTGTVVLLRMHRGMNSELRTWLMSAKKLHLITAPVKYEDVIHSRTVPV